MISVTETLARESEKRNNARHRAARAVRPVRPLEHPEQGEHSNRLFIGRLMNEWLAEASLRPAKQQLAGELWREGELVLSYGSTGEGKTGLAMQIANDNATGRSTTTLAVGDPAKELYFDFELSDSQHLSRYSNHNHVF